jgi:hypothetical protein
VYNGYDNHHDYIINNNKNNSGEAVHHVYQNMDYSPNIVDRSGTKPSSSSSNNESTIEMSDHNRRRPPRPHNNYVSTTTAKSATTLPVAVDASSNDGIVLDDNSFTNDTGNKSIDNGHNHHNNNNSRSNSSPSPEDNSPETRLVTTTTTHPNEPSTLVTVENDTETAVVSSGAHLSSILQSIPKGVAVNLNVNYHGNVQIGDRNYQGDHNEDSKETSNPKFNKKMDAALGQILNGLKESRDTILEGQKKGNQKILDKQEEGKEQILEGIRLSTTVKKKGGIRSTPSPYLGIEVSPLERRSGNKTVAFAPSVDTAGKTETSGVVGTPGPKRQIAFESPLVETVDEDDCQSTVEVAVGVPFHGGKNLSTLQRLKESKEEEDSSSFFSPRTWKAVENWSGLGIGTPKSNDGDDDFEPIPVTGNATTANAFGMNFFSPGIGNATDAVAMTPNSDTSFKSLWGMQYNLPGIQSMDVSPLGGPFLSPSAAATPMSTSQLNSPMSVTGSNSPMSWISSCLPPVSSPFLFGNSDLENDWAATNGTAPPTPASRGKTGSTLTTLQSQPALQNQSTPRITRSTATGTSTITTKTATPTSTPKPQLSNTPLIRVGDLVQLNDGSKGQVISIKTNGWYKIYVEEDGTETNLRRSNITRLKAPPQA